MDNTTIITPKAWWASKTYQGLIVAVVAKGYALLAQHYHWTAWDTSDTELVTNLLELAGAAWATVGLRTAIKPVGDPSKPITVPLTPAGTANGEPPAGGSQ